MIRCIKWYRCTGRVKRQRVIAVQVSSTEWHQPCIERLSTDGSSRMWTDRHQRLSIKSKCKCFPNMRKKRNKNHVNYNKHWHASTAWTVDLPPRPPSPCGSDWQDTLTYGLITNLNTRFCGNTRYQQQAEDGYLVWLTCECRTGYIRIVGFRFCAVCSCVCRDTCTSSADSTRAKCIIHVVSVYVGISKTPGVGYCIKKFSLLLHVVFNV